MYDESNLDPTFEQFKAIINETLEARLNDVQTTLKVEAVVPIIHDDSGPQPFSVLLLGPAQASKSMLPKGMVEVFHPALGRHDLFMAPVGKDETTVRYEIIFN